MEIITIMNTLPEYPKTPNPSNTSEADSQTTMCEVPVFMHGVESVLFGFNFRRSVLTKSQQAYALVRRAIVTHELPSNVPLDEGLLLEHFACGRTPLREALKRLSFESLLVWSPRQAPMIRDVGLYEMQHLYTTRRILEYEVAILAAERATDEDIERMNTFRTQLSEASQAGLVYEAVELDFGLHSAIARATQNRFLVEASDNLNLQSLRLWFRAQNEHGVFTIDKMHSELVSAISQHDTQRARELTAAHIDSSFSRQQLLTTGGASTLR